MEFLRPKSCALKRLTKTEGLEALCLVLFVNAIDVSGTRIERAHHDTSGSRTAADWLSAGIVNRLGVAGADARRLRHLAAFQTRVLLHSLAFPAARRVVYSTCSTRSEENEDVVFNVLSKVRER